MGVPGIMGSGTAEWAMRFKSHHDQETIDKINYGEATQALNTRFGGLLDEILKD
jgi:hypothetical protein